MWPIEYTLGWRYTLKFTLESPSQHSHCVTSAAVVISSTHSAAVHQVEWQVRRILQHLYYTQGSQGSVAGHRQVLNWCVLTAILGIMLVESWSRILNIPAGFLSLVAHEWKSLTHNIKATEWRKQRAKKTNTWTTPNPTPLPPPSSWLKKMFFITIKPFIHKKALRNCLKVK